jgi:hypothetical protein
MRVAALCLVVVGAGKSPSDGSRKKKARIAMDLEIVTPVPGAGIERDAATEERLVRKSPGSTLDPRAQTGVPSAARDTVQYSFG